MVPANTPVYFQLLDEKGDVIQTMRSWSTLMPGETFSCVGCHEDKNLAPTAASKFTLAMKKGVQRLSPDLWMSQFPEYENFDPYNSKGIGFSYLKTVQKILDNNCITCHSNTEAAYEFISVGSMQNAKKDAADIVIDYADSWSFTTTAPSGDWTKNDFDYSKWAVKHAPFGSSTSLGELNTKLSNNPAYFKRTAFLTQYDLSTCTIILSMKYSGEIKVYFNGNLVYSDTNPSSSYKDIEVTPEMKQHLVVGHNQIAVYIGKGSSSMYFDLALKAGPSVGKTTELISKASTWEYRMSSSGTADPGWNTDLNFTANGWKTGRAPFGDRGGQNTSWTGADTYIWIRQKFEVNNINDFVNALLYMDVFYDDSAYFYLNGQLIFSDGGWVDAYTIKKLADNAAQYLKQGTNLFAVSLHNTAGGRQIDLSLYAVKNTVQKTTVLETRAEGWRYVINQTPAANWYEKNFNDSSWSVGKAGFGSINNPGTSWTGDNSSIWIRKKFNIDDISKLSGMKLSLEIFYDESPVVYLNGTKIYEASGYVTDYLTVPLTAEQASLLVQGENVIAISARNTYGGLYIDAGITAVPASAPISFEGINVHGQRQLKYFPLSYLVLTNSTPKSGVNWVGNSVNRYTNWVSSMSKCEILKPYEYGANKSNIIKKLRTGHGGLTDEEIRAIACWIDLGVPAYGSYDENVNWNDNARREFEEKTKKREFYDMLNKYAMLERAGLTPKGDISISYTPKNSKMTFKASGEGLVILNTEIKYQQGDVIRITLPEGQKYLMLSLSSKMGEALIYVPKGTLTLSLPDLTKAYPNTVRNTSGIAYTANTITARLATEEDLKQVRNLAHNPYDQLVVSNAFPHATSNNVYNNQSEFEARNVIDGFTANKGHGTYPSQSWGPNSSGSLELTINFGREVNLQELQIFIRADFPHDTHFLKATVEFSDGSTMDINFRKTAEVQKFIIEGGKTTSSIKFKNFEKNNSGGWAALSEVIALGTEIVK